MVDVCGKRQKRKNKPGECDGFARNASNVVEGVQFLYWVLGASTQWHQLTSTRAGRVAVSYAGRNRSVMRIVSLSGCNSMARVSDFQSDGCGFESHHPLFGRERLLGNYP